MRKSVLFICLVAVILFLKYTFFTKTNVLEIPELLASSRSKEFCSCYFILKNNEDYCLNQVLKGYPLFKYFIGNGLVSFSNPLYRSTSVVSVDKKYGCYFKK